MELVERGVVDGVDQAETRECLSCGLEDSSTITPRTGILGKNPGNRVYIWGWGIPFALLGLFWLGLKLFEWLR